MRRLRLGVSERICKWTEFCFGSEERADDEPREREIDRVYICSDYLLCQLFDRCDFHT